ncbi:sensor histidine kinase [Sphingobacterium kyonggiense]
MKIPENIDRILNLGILDEDSFLVKKEIRLANIITVSCSIIIFIYGFINIWKFPIIGIANFIGASLMILTLGFHAKRKLRTGQIWFLTSMGLLLAFVNFISPNTTEYFLISLIALSLLVLRDNISKIILSIFVSAAIIIPKYLDYSFPFLEHVAKHRLIFNSIWGLVILIVLSYYLRSIQKKYQEEIEEKSAQINDLNRDLKHLFAIIAHDIHSPLQSSTTMLKDLSGTQMSNEWKETAIKLVHKQLATLQINLNNLLEWSRHNMQGLQTMPEGILLAKIVNETLKSMEERFLEKEIQIDIQIAHDIQVYADPIQFTVILRNLLDNALKFSNPNGLIAIKASEEKENTTISIEDHGVGIDQQFIDSLFHTIKDPSFGTSGERGTGLGLVLVDKLIQANHGTVKIKSKPEQGTTILIDLPNR